jgi:hypothetical protein
VDVHYRSAQLSPPWSPVSDCEVDQRDAPLQIRVEIKGPSNRSRCGQILSGRLYVKMIVFEQTRYVSKYFRMKK